MSDERGQIMQTDNDWSGGSTRDRKIQDIFRSKFEEISREAVAAGWASWSHTPHFSGKGSPAYWGVVVGEAWSEFLELRGIHVFKSCRQAISEIENAEEMITVWNPKIGRAHV